MKKMLSIAACLLALVFFSAVANAASANKIQPKSWEQHFNSPEFRAKVAESYKAMFGRYPKGWNANIASIKPKKGELRLVGDGTCQFSRPEYLKLVVEASAKYEEAREGSSGLGNNTAHKVRRIMKLYEKEIKAATSRFPNVSAEEVAAVILYESGGKPTAVSKAGAKGLMQLMPGTAKYLGVANSFHPAQNIMGGTRYLSEQISKFGDRRRAYVAYWAGPGRAYRYNLDKCKYANQVFAAQQAVISESMLASAK